MYFNDVFTDAKLLLHCNQPRQKAKLTMKFQSFSPNPNGLVFYPGESYYLMCKLMIEHN